MILAIASAIKQNVKKNSFQMLVLICHTTKCHISEAASLHSHCCKNLSFPLSVHPLYCPLSSIQSWDTWVSIVTGLWPGQLRNCGPQFPAGPRDLTFTEHPPHFWVCSILFSRYRGFFPQGTTANAWSRLPVVHPHLPVFSQHVHGLSNVSASYSVPVIGYYCGLCSFGVTDRRVNLQFHGFLHCLLIYML